jgi:hypothetical protein
MITNLQGEDINFNQSQISILRWMVELGRVAIVGLPSTPREGHLEAVYSIYGYLKLHSRSNMFFNTSYVNWTAEGFPLHDWEDYYKDTNEEIPKNAPTPRGQSVQINMFVNANHAGNMPNCRSQAGSLKHRKR